TAQPHGLDAAEAAVQASAQVARSGTSGRLRRRFGPVAEHERGGQPECLDDRVGSDAASHRGWPAPMAHSAASRTGVKPAIAESEASMRTASAVLRALSLSSARVRKVSTVRQLRLSLCATSLAEWP